MNRNRPFIIFFVFGALLSSLLVSWAAEPPLRPAEQYFIELRDYLDKIDQESGATAKDWESYVKKIYRENRVKISLPSNMTEEQKKDYLKSIALALLFAKNQFGFDLPQKIREFRCAPSRPGTFGRITGTRDYVVIICPSGQSTNWTFTVFFHELAHMMRQHPFIAGREYEDDIHNFIRQHIPSVIGPDNRPQNYDLFAPSGNRSPSLSPKLVPSRR